MTTPTTNDVASTINEMRYYNSESGILQCIFSTEPNDQQIVIISDPLGNVWHEGNREWIGRYFPQIKADVEQEPVDRWTW